VLGNNPFHFGLKNGSVIDGVEIFFDPTPGGVTLTASQVSSSKYARQASASPLMSGGAPVTSCPSTLSSIISPIPPIRKAMTGFDMAISITARGSGSS
jgi:hypothetical protein